jgi:hypothetical protein
VDGLHVEKVAVLPRKMKKVAAPDSADKLSGHRYPLHDLNV